MAKYLLLKHYRGAPAAVNDVPMDQWTPEEISAHMQYMQDWAARLEVWRDRRSIIGASDAGAHLDFLATFGFPTTML